MSLSRLALLFVLFLFTMFDGDSGAYFVFLVAAMIALGIQFIASLAILQSVLVRYYDRRKAVQSRAGSVIMLVILLLDLFCVGMICVSLISDLYVMIVAVPLILVELVLIPIYFVVRGKIYDGRD